MLYYSRLSDNTEDSEFSMALDTPEIDISDELPAAALIIEKDRSIKEV